MRSRSRAATAPAEQKVRTQPAATIAGHTAAARSRSCKSVLVAASAPAAIAARLSAAQKCARGPRPPALTARYHRVDARTAPAAGGHQRDGPASVAPAKTATTTATGIAHIACIFCTVTLPMTILPAAT